MKVRKDLLQGTQRHFWDKGKGRFTGKSGESLNVKFPRVKNKRVDTGKGVKNVGVNGRKSTTGGTKSPPSGGKKTKEETEAQKRKVKKNSNDIASWGPVLGNLEKILPLADWFPEKGGGRHGNRKGRLHWVAKNMQNISGEKTQGVLLWKMGEKATLSRNKLVPKQGNLEKSRDRPPNPYGGPAKKKIKLHCGKESVRQCPKKGLAGGARSTST